MSVYAIGDVHGCYDELQLLLEKLKFDQSQDTLWFTGDLISRGNQSLETLRLIKSLGKDAVSVLGNHDLHLLALFNQHPKFDKPPKSLKQVLKAEDLSEMAHWLRHQKILHSEFGYHLVHAGIYPFWSLEFAQTQAKRLEKVLQGDNYADFILQMYGNEPQKWQDAKTNTEQLRFVVNSFTRMRFLKPDGGLDFKFKDNESCCDLDPWFKFNKIDNVIFGHWASLTKIEQNNTFAIDTACVWGGELTAFNLEEKTIFQVECNVYK